MTRILHGNLLINTIPKEIGLLKNLKVLDLGSNQLTGPIPPEIGKLNSIVKMLVENESLHLIVSQASSLFLFSLFHLLTCFVFPFCSNLESNGLTGRLPSELGNLKYLQELRLDRNKLKGVVPAANGSDFPANTNGM